MTFVDLYNKSSAAQKIDSVLYLEKYSHLFRWKDYKENILDVGCGDGYVTKAVLYPYVKDHLEKLQAVDLQEEMIEYAKATNSNDKICYRKIDVAKYEDFANLSMKFDHIFSFYCIHWIVDQTALFKRFYDSLNLGGQIFIIACPHSSLHTTFKKLSEKNTWSKYLPKDSAHADYTDQPEEYIRKLAEQSGFTVELCKMERKATPFKDCGDFIRSMITMHSLTKYIPEELREKYIQDHIQGNYELSSYDKETGVYSIPYEALVLIATKE